MKIYDIEDTEVAEAIFWYCQMKLPDYQKEWKKNNGITMLQYARNRIEEFKKFTKLNWDYEVKDDRIHRENNRTRNI